MCNTEPSLRDALLRGQRRGKNPLGLLDGWSERDAEFVLTDWLEFARADQKPPEGDWLTWLLLGGRGAGKTRAGAEWVRGVALGMPPFADGPAGRIALVGETYADVREVMIEGVSGLLAGPRRIERPVWQPTGGGWSGRTAPSPRRSPSEDPESLRGPQFAAAWSDELAKWRYAEATWDMLQFGLRLGEPAAPGGDHHAAADPADPPADRRRRHGGDPGDDGHERARTSRRDSSSRVVGRYAGTRLGRQELEGELIEDRADALWQRQRHRERHGWRRPAASPHRRCRRPAGLAAERGMRHRRRRARAGRRLGYVLADATVAEVRPDEWAAAALRLYRAARRRRAGRRGQPGRRHGRGGVPRGRPGVPVTKVRATRGKWLRAEPVAALYAQGRVRHVGALPELEDELCDFGPDGLSRRPLARPARRAGLGDHRADARRRRRAAGAGGVRGPRRLRPRRRPDRPKAPGHATLDRTTRRDFPCPHGVAPLRPQTTRLSGAP